MHAALAAHERALNAAVEHPLMCALELPCALLVGRAVAAAGDGDVEIRFTGGQFASGETAPDHPFARLVRSAVSAEIGRDAAVAGAPWGADMRLWCERGIPCVMAGPAGIERAHAVDERVRVDDLVTVARAILRVVFGYSAAAR